MNVGSMGTGMGKKNVAETDEYTSSVKTTIIIFILSIVLALTFSLIAMSNSTYVRTYSLGSLDLANENVLDVYDEVTRIGVSGSIENAVLVADSTGCNENLKYSLVDYWHNTTSNSTLVRNSTSRIPLSSLHTLLIIDPSSNCTCKISFSIDITYREYNYRYLAIPGFIFFAISIAAMYRFLTMVVLEKTFREK